MPLRGPSGIFGAMGSLIQGGVGTSARMPSETPTERAEGASKEEDPSASKPMRPTSYPAFARMIRDAQAAGYYPFFHPVKGSAGAEVEVEEPPLRVPPNAPDPQVTVVRDCSDDRKKLGLRPPGADLHVERQPLVRQRLLQLTHQHSLHLTYSQQETPTTVEGKLTRQGSGRQKRR